MKRIRTHETRQGVGERTGLGRELVRVEMEMEKGRKPLGWLGKKLGRLFYRYPRLWVYSAFSAVLGSYAVPALWDFGQGLVWERTDEEKRQRAITNELRWRYGVGFVVPIFGWTFSLQNPEVAERKLRMNLLKLKQKGIPSTLQKTLDETQPDDLVDVEER
jgi:hypothetical protein